MDFTQLRQGILPAVLNGFKNTKPKRSLLLKKVKPTIQSGDGNLPVFTEQSNGACSRRIAFQDGENEAKCVRAEGDQDIWKNGMGTSAGRTENSGDGNGDLGANAIFHRNHMPGVS